MNNPLSHRSIYLLGFFIILAFLGFAVYLEMFQGVNPCPLCILQRICLVILAVFFLIGGIFPFKKIGRFLIGFSASLITLAGIVLSGRQVWLQHNPSGLSSNCDVSLQYLIHVMPLDQLIKKIFVGGTECSQVAWEFLQLSLAEWSLISFLFFFMVCVWQLCRRGK